MAQSGSVLAWGARGRGFKSRYPDSNKPSSENELGFFMGLYIIAVMEEHPTMWNYRIGITSRTNK